MTLDFLKSNRFWAIVLLGVVLALGDTGVLTATTVQSLVVVLSGFIGIRTVDRFSEKIGNGRM